VRRETPAPTSRRRAYRAATWTVGHPLANPAKEVSHRPGALVPGISPPLHTPPPRALAPASACAPYRELIEAALTCGRDAMAIWRDLVDDHGSPPSMRASVASSSCFVVSGPSRHIR